MRIGAHVGIGGGWPEAVDYCVEIGAECLQVFSKSPRMWRPTRLDLDAVAAFRVALVEHDIGPVFVHTSYLINLGSGEEGLWERSIDALAEEFRRAAAVKAEGLVTHVGTDAFDDRSRAADRIANAVATARTRTDDAGRDCRLLLENSAGAGTHFGGSAAEIGRLACGIEDRDAGPVGVCLDSCHAFAFGYPLETSADWRQILDEFEAECGVGSIRLVHANDCKYERGERRDRHAWIGDGHLGTEAFRALMSEPRLSDVPLVVEMPGEPPQKDRINVERLKAVRNEALGT